MQFRASEAVVCSLLLIIFIPLLSSCATVSEDAIKEYQIENPLAKGYASLGKQDAVAELAGSEGMSGSDDAVGERARFNHPQGIANDGTNLYVTDYGNHIIRMIVISTGDVTTLAGSAGKRGVADGDGVSARFNYPVGIATDGKSVYVVDTKNNAIRKIDISTRMVTTLTGDIDKQGYTDSDGENAQYFELRDIATDGENLYVTDVYGHVVRKIVITTGEVTTLAGQSKVKGDADGAGTSAQFSYPTGITTDGSNLYVTDGGSGAIRKVVLTTGEVTTIACLDEAVCAIGCKGRCPRKEIDDDRSTARFIDPVGITTDGVRLFVTGSGTVWSIEIATGEVTILSSGSVDVPIKFHRPAGITTDGLNLYVADSQGHNIYKLTIPRESQGSQTQ